MDDENVIRLGYDDAEEDEHSQKQKISGQKFVKLKKEYVPPYLSPEKLAEIKAEMSCSVVHDFRDQYHLTEEEREKRYQLYKCFKAVDFKTVKFKINKLSDYVKTMRKCLKCLELVSENNGCYEPEEFMQQYFDDKIEIYGFKFPKFTNKKIKRRIDPKFLIQFILSDTPADQIDYVMGIKELPDVAESSRPMPLIDDADLERMTNIDHNIEDMNTMIKKSYTLDDGESDDSGVITEVGIKETKSIIKNIPGVIDTMTDIRNAYLKDAKKEKYLFDYTFSQLSEKDLAKIAAHDAKYGKKAPKGKKPVFEGDIMDTKAYNKYLRDVYDYEREITRVQSSRFSNETMSLEEREEDELKDVLSSAGLNVRAMWNSKEIENAQYTENKLAKYKTNRLRDTLAINQQLREKKLTPEQAKMAKDMLKKKYKKKKDKLKKKGK